MAATLENMLKAQRNAALDQVAALAAANDELSDNLRLALSQLESQNAKVEILSRDHSAMEAKMQAAIADRDRYRRLLLSGKKLVEGDEVEPSEEQKEQTNEAE